MSTKTTFKRIALATVASMGFGLLSVVPANAAESLASVVTSISATTTAGSVEANANKTVTVAVKHTAVTTTNEITVKAAVISKPAASTATIGTPTGGTNVTATGTVTGIAFTTTGTSASQAIIIADYTVATTTPPANSLTSLDASINGGANGIPYGTFTVQGDTAGTYTLRVWHDAAGVGIVDAGETFTDVSFTVAGSISDAYGTFTSSAATPTVAVSVAEGSSTSLLVTYSGVNDDNNNLYYMQTASAANTVVAHELTPAIVQTTAGVTADSGTLALTNGNTAGQVRVDVVMDLAAVASEFVKICYTPTCVAGTELLWLVVDTALTNPSIAQGADISAAPFAVSIPSAVANVTYSSAVNATVSQVATTGGYVQLTATHEDLTGPALPDFKFVEVTGSTFIGASTVAGTDMSFNNPNTSVAAGSTVATIIVGGTLAADTLLIGTATAGQIIVRVKTRTFSAGLATDTTNQTFIINVGTSPVTYNYSTVAIDAANNGWEALDSTIYAPSTAGTVADSTNIATVVVSQFAASNAAILAGTAKAVTATLTGVGSLTPSSSAGTSRTYEVRAAAGSGTDTFKVYADGRAGTGSIAFAVDGVLVKTATIKFYGAATKVEVVPFYTIGREGNGITGYATGVLDSAAYAGSAGNYASLAVTPTATNDTAIGVLVTDALGTPVPSSVTVTSSNPGVIVPSTTSFLDSGASTLYSAGVWYRHFAFDTAPNAKSGQTATLTFTVTLASGTALTASQALTVGGARHTETLTFDKASYNAGDQMFVARKAVDDAGNPVYDGSTAPAITFNKATSGSIGASIYVGGVAVVSSRPSAYAPATTGAFEARMTGVKAGATSVITATATVEATGTAAEATAQAAADAAAEATDAANAATDAANAAAEAADAATAAAQDAADAVAALSTSVTAMVDALRKQITSLTNLVIKIQKKVKA